MKDYLALGIEIDSMRRVLRIVERKYGIQIDTAWEKSGKKVFYLRGQGWEVTVKVDLKKKDNSINII